MPTLDFNQTHLIMLIAALIIVAAAVAFVSWRARRGLKPFALTTETVQVGEWTWRYHTSGRGPNLILIHGIGANLYCWSHLIPLLTPHYKVWAIDLPGFGASSKSTHEHYGLDDQVERLEQFMNE